MIGQNLLEQPYVQQWTVKACTVMWSMIIYVIVNQWRHVMGETSRAQEREQIPELLFRLRQHGYIRPRDIKHSEDIWTEFYRLLYCLCEFLILIH